MPDNSCSAPKDPISHGLAIPFFLTLSFFFCLPLLRDLNVSCRGDWDYFSHLYEVAGVSLWEYGQLPLWNPYSCGGIPLIGNPQSGFPSPIFLATSLFGVLPGLKISIWLHTFLGLWGNWLLAGHLGIKGPARFAPPVIFMFASAWALHLAEGHIVWLPAAFLPLMVLGFLKGLRDSRWLVFAAFCQGVMVYEGGTYVLAYALLFLGVYAAGLALEQVRWRPVCALLAMNVVAAGFTAPKVLPVLQMLAGHPRPSGAAEFVTWDQLVGGLIERDGTLGSIESSCYLGLVVVVLYLVSLFRVKRQFPLALASICLFVVSIGNFGTFAPWTMLHTLPVFQNFQCPTRVMVVFGFSASLMIGLLLGSRDPKEPRWMPLMIGLLVAGITVDLFTLGSSLLGQAARPVQMSLFTLDHGQMRRTKPVDLYRVPTGRSSRLGDSVTSLHTPFSQVAVPGMSRFAHGGWSDQYPELLKNRGVVDAYETLPVEEHALAVADPAYRGEYHLTSPGKGTVSLKRWSPNAFIFHISLQTGNRLVMNQNFWPGWHASTGLIRESDGLISVDLAPGDYDLRLYYLPLPFLIGAAICLATVAVALCFVTRQRGTKWR